jgi:23S rRNA pseudouridine1911/1915/1917 synthase
MEPEIIYKTKDFLIVNKPAGLLVHQIKAGFKIYDSRFKEPTLVDWLLKNYPEIKAVGDDPKTRPGIVHRLDKDTSGVMIIARNQKTFDYLKKLFQNHEIKKTYLVLIWGKVEPKIGIINKPIGLKAGTVKRTTWLKGVKLTREAITKYRVLKYSASNIKQEISLVEAEPLTGRTHQIRIHFASIGHPVVGDKLYGKKEMPEGLTRQFLHAESLEFTALQGERLKIAADLPKDLDEFLRRFDYRRPSKND